MAASGITPEAALTARLNELLRRARELKHSTSIDPPLQVSTLVGDDEPFLQPPGGDKEVHNLGVESAAKSIFYATLASTKISDPSFVTVWNLLDILQYCGDRELCPQQLVLLLVEELLDSLSIAGCRIAFSFLESRREVLIASRSQNKDLVILRLCNELLRRLSRAEDPAFCGRVYIFLFQSFPLGDKSSVNLRGNFHVENITTFEDYLKTSEQSEDAMQVDTTVTNDNVNGETLMEDAGAQPTEGDEPAAQEKPETMDIDTLYPVFWSLQHFFSNPPRLFEEENFETFRKSLEATLAKFKEVPKVIQAGESAGKTGTPSSADAEDEFASTFNPKYLTSRDLFKLELSDVAFQRHILVQTLILIDFLLTLTEKSKSNSYYQNAQKAMQYNFTLREEHTEWALGIKQSIANYLQEGPDGKFYYRMVDTVLSRDKNWVRWKMENCQSFTRDRVAANDFLESKSGARQAVADKKAPKPMGMPATLRFLSSEETEKGLEELTEEDRFVQPSPQAYTARIETIDLDSEMPGTTDEERLGFEEQKMSCTWRGLRLAAQQDQLSLFDRFDHEQGLKSLFQPAKPRNELTVTSSDNAPTAPDDKGLVPQEEEHRGIEEQRAGQQSQVTADMMAQ